MTDRVQVLDPDAPYFICDRCLRVTPCYIGRYHVPDRITGAAHELCHSCWSPDGNDWSECDEG